MRIDVDISGRHDAAVGKLQEVVPRLAGGGAHELALPQQASVAVPLDQRKGATRVRHRQEAAVARLDGTAHLIRDVIVRRGHPGLRMNLWRESLSQYEKQVGFEADLHEADPTLLAPNVRAPQPRCCGSKLSVYGEILEIGRQAMKRIVKECQIPGGRRDQGTKRYPSP